MIYDAIIVGAGISGITAGNKLIEKGLNVKLLDKGKMLGGRLATRRISYNGKKTVFDYGCKYLEASSFEFSTKIVDLIRGNNLKKWNVINQNSLLNELDKSLKFISKIIYTHWHIDHTLCSYFVPNVLIISTKYTNDYLRNFIDKDLVRLTNKGLIEKGVKPKLSDIEFEDKHYF